MSEGADIPIHIIIRQEGAEDVANKIEALTEKLTELTVQSEALQRPLRSISRSFNSLTRGVDSSFESLDRSMMVIARNIDVIENFNSRMMSLARSSRRVRSALRALTEAGEYQPQLWNNLRNAVRGLQSAQRGDIATINRMQRLYRILESQLRGYGVTVRQAIQIYRTAATRAGLSTQQFARAMEVAREIQERFNVSVRMTPQNVARVYRSYGMLQAVVRDTGLSLEDLSRLFPGMFTRLITGAESSSTAFRLFSQNVKELIDVSRQFGIPLELLTSGIRQTTGGITVATEGIKTFAAALKASGVSSTEVLTRLLDTLFRIERGIPPTVEGFRLMSRGFKEMQQGAYIFVRQLFWVGLGTMFLTMSMDRLNRRILSTRRELLSLVRAEERLADLHRQYREAVQEYGASSEEARRILRDLRMEEMQMEMQRQEYIESQRQMAYAQVMLWASAAAQVVGSGAVILQSMTLMSMGYRDLTLGAYMAGQAQQQQGAAAIVAGTENQIAAFQTKLLNMSFWEMFTSALTASVGLNTAGKAAMLAGLKFALAKALAAGLIGALVMIPTMLAAYAYANYQASRATANLEKEIGDLRKQLAGSGLEEDLSLVANRLREVQLEAHRGGMEVDRLYRRLSEGQVTIRPRITVRREEEQLQVRRVYEEIKHVREGLGIHSPGLQIEMPQLDRMLYELKKARTTPMSDMYSKLTYLEIHAIREGFGIRSPGVPVLEELNRLIHLSYLALLSLPGMAVSTREFYETQELIRETERIREGPEKVYREILKSEQLKEYLRQREIVEKAIAPPMRVETSERVEHFTERIIQGPEKTFLETYRSLRDRRVDTRRERETYVMRERERVIVPSFRMGYPLPEPRVILSPAPELRIERQHAPIIVPLNITVKASEKIDEARLIAKMRNELLRTLEALGVR